MLAESAIKLIFLKKGCIFYRPRRSINDQIGTIFVQNPAVFLLSHVYL